MSPASELAAAIAREIAEQFFSGSTGVEASKTELAAIIAARLAPIVEDGARSLVEAMRAYKELHVFMSTEQNQQGGTFHLVSTSNGTIRAISNAEAHSLISRFYDSDERAVNAMRDIKEGTSKCISVKEAMIEYWPIAQANSIAADEGRISTPPDAALAGEPRS
jgi:hypothetical protein